MDNAIPPQSLEPVPHDDIFMPLTLDEIRLMGTLLAANHEVIAHIGAARLLAEKCADILSVPQAERRAALMKAAVN